MFLKWPQKYIHNPTLLKDHLLLVKFIDWVFGFTFPSVPQQIISPIECMAAQNTAKFGLRSAMNGFHMSSQNVLRFEGPVTHSAHLCT